jgi:hypothetical protein
VTEPPKSPLSDPGFVAGLRPIPSHPDGTPPDWPAADVVGVRPDGTPVTIDLAAATRPVLMVFLTTECDGCDQFWWGLSDPPPEVDAVVVTRGPGAVASSDVATLASGLSRVPVVMSDAAWSDYRVTGYPFLVLVEPATRRILGESVGFGWPDVEGLLASSAVAERPSRPPQP